MHTSIIIAAHNEGRSLANTIRSCVDTCADLDREIIVADDASADGSVDQAISLSPQIRVARHDRRLGASPTKQLGARAARGDTLVFLDAHCKPEMGAICRLAEGVELADRKTIITPEIPTLDVGSWRNCSHQVGCGYSLRLKTFESNWLPLNKLRAVSAGGRQFHESPALIGCAFAIDAAFYERLWGFDSHMLMWGVEDLDLGLKCWLMGGRILHDSQPRIGHRFRDSFDNYDVPPEQVLVNQLRMARKHFTHSVWADWLDRCRRRNDAPLPGHPEGLWARAWELFEQHRPSVEQERAYLQANRARDEFWFANHFGLQWPRLAKEIGSGGETRASAYLQQAPSATPSPSPSVSCGCVIQWQPYRSLSWISLGDATTNVMVGEKVKLRLSCPANPTVSNTQWSIPERSFKEFDFTFTPGGITYGRVIRFSGSDLTNKTLPEFAWSSTGKKTVLIEFERNGEECWIQHQFMVHDPVVELPDGYETPPIGEIGFANSANDTIKLLPPVGEDDGIQFKASISRPNTPSGLLEGSWAFAQFIILPQAIERFDGGPNDGKCFDFVTPELALVLDSQFPYRPNPGDYFPADGSIREAPDSPEFPLNGIDRIRYQVPFRMFLMYKPTRSEFQVPIAYCDWKIEFCAERDESGDWIIKSSDTRSNPWVVGSSNIGSGHPEWSKKIGGFSSPSNLGTHEIPCPNPFCETSNAS